MPRASKKRSTRRKRYAKGRYVAVRTGGRRRQASRTVSTARRRTFNTRMPLSPCGKNYLKLQYDPFTPVSGLFCIPDTVAIPSQKLTLRQRGSFFCDANGDGIILLNPYNIIGQASKASNDCPIAYSAATDGTHIMGGSYSSFNVYTELDKANPLIIPAGWDSPFNAAQTAANKIRVVGAGLRISYAGKYDDLKGSIQVFKHPTNKTNFWNTPLNIKTGAALLAFDETAYGAISHNMVYSSVYHPATLADFEYHSPTDEVSEGGGSFTRNRSFTNAIYVQGCTQADNSFTEFTWEAIVHVELVGPDATGILSSDVDLVAFPEVLALPKQQFLNTPAPTVTSFMWARLKESLSSKAAMRIGQNVVNKALNWAGSWLGSAPAGPMIEDIS